MEVLYTWTYKKTSIVIMKRQGHSSKATIQYNAGTALKTIKVEEYVKILFKIVNKYIFATLKWKYTTSCLPTDN